MYVCKSIKLHFVEKYDNKSNRFYINHPKMNLLSSILGESTVHIGPVLDMINIDR